MDATCNKCSYSFQCKAPLPPEEIFYNDEIDFEKNPLWGISSTFSWVEVPNANSYQLFIQYLNGKFKYREIIPYDSDVLVRTVEQGKVNIISRNLTQLNTTLDIFPHSYLKFQVRSSNSYGYSDWSELKQVQTGKIHGSDENDYFTDVTKESGIYFQGWLTYGIALGDFNNDGFVDVYSVNHGNLHTFYINDGGLFKEVADTAFYCKALNGTEGKCNDIWPFHDTTKEKCKRK